MTNLLLMGVGNPYIPFITVSSSSSSAANPQLQFFENFPGKHGGALLLASLNTLSIHAVNIPLSLSFNYPVIGWGRGASTSGSGAATFSLGLYSLTGSTFSLANSASASDSFVSCSANYFVWVSLITSATQNISPGPWYFAYNIRQAGGAIGNFYGVNPVNPVNANPAMIRGRMTASTNALPASIATSDLDITGGDANRQYYIIITA